MSEPTKQFNTVIGIGKTDEGQWMITLSDGTAHLVVMAENWTLVGREEQVLDALCRTILEGHAIRRLDSENDQFKPGEEVYGKLLRSTDLDSLSRSWSSNLYTLEGVSNVTNPEAEGPEG